MKKLKFFVVIHALSMKEKYENANLHIQNQAKIAFENGTDGIFIIPDYEKGIALRAKEADLITFYHALKKQFKNTDFKIGLNFSFDEVKSIHLGDIITNNNIEMIQTNSLLIDSKKFPNTEIFTNLEFDNSLEGLDVIGEEFKKRYREIIKNNTIINLTSKEDESFLISNIRNIKSRLPSDYRLSISGGIDIQNMQSFIDAGVTDFLVATSLIKEVENDFDILDPQKVAEISEIIRKNNSKT